MTCHQSEPGMVKAGMTEYSQITLELQGRKALPGHR